MKRPCLDCGTPTDQSRCPRCTTGFDRIRNREATIRRNRGGGRPAYGSRFRKEGGRVRATATTCWICGDGKRDNDPWQADHVIPVQNGGGEGPLLPAHRSCNIARANQLRAGKPDRALERLTRKAGGGGQAPIPTDTTDEPA